MRLNSFFNYLIVKITDVLLAAFSLPIFNNPRMQLIYSFDFIQPLLEEAGRCKAWEVYKQAQKNCPAYAKFLYENLASDLKRKNDFYLLPLTDKNSYIKKYSVEDRCLYGTIPTRGVIIDESSGSSGTPNNWVRGPAERAAVKRLIQNVYKIRYGAAPLMVLNCFALGPWATGMNVSMSLVDLAIMKSLGPEKSKLEATLELFGPKYRYILAGYPPFFKDWFSNSKLDLSAYELHLIVGGEGISEGLRDFFLQKCKSVFSSYGASDLEINIGAESEYTIALRKLCISNPQLSYRLFGREDAPMIFQYNPINYMIESTKEGELVVSILRLNNVAPRLRYNIHDIGGARTFSQVNKILAEFDLVVGGLSQKSAALPLLYVYGRNDLSVPFYGAKVFSTDIDQLINGRADWRNSFNAFQISVKEEASLDKTLIIDLELAANSTSQFSLSELSQEFYHGLQRVNQDFREVSKIFGAERILVRLHNFTQGPFEKRDIRVKNRYIA